jgi:site-specific DNA recombinase
MFWKGVTEHRCRPQYVDDRYCRVSTEEQAAERFSIEGQAEKLRMYATLRDLGPVTMVEDPGRSGKNLDRPGLRQILAAIEQGHVSQRGP